MVYGHKRIKIMKIWQSVDRGICCTLMYRWGPLSQNSDDPLNFMHRLVKNSCLSRSRYATLRTSIPFQTGQLILTVGFAHEFGRNGIVCRRTATSKGRICEITQLLSGKKKKKKDFFP